ncbi:aminotransferase class V-fold PLP-dependent enzyme, partial [Anaerosalibacter bizertensis]|nr:aminotransferase class V-fold PLP-dependent enzyme [Anaerosalibacter bizertensis]
EKLLAGYALEKIKNIPNINLYCDSTIYNRVSIIPFNIEGIHHEKVAEILAAEGGIAVRSGCFCAQPYIQKLLKVNTEDMEKYRKDPTLPRPGMVRISFGIYNNFEEINIFMKLLEDIAVNIEKYNNKYRKPPFF